LKVTAKAIDVNDVFVEVSLTSATITSTFAIAKYKCTDDGSGS